MINRIQVFIILSAILIVAAYLRLYQIENYNYYGDSARDLLKIHNWFTTGKIPLQGPITSMGTFHLGPFYYYLLAPFVFLFNNDPIGIVYFEITDGLLFVAVGFLFLYKLVDFSTAFIFSFLITLSPLAILLSRGSWNPHPQFLVTLLILFSFMQFIKTNFFRYIFISAFLVGIGIQLHYTFLANFFSLILLIFLFKRSVVLNYKMWLLFIIGFILPLLPFLIGQVINGFIDIRLALDFINQSQSEKKFFMLKSILDRLTYTFEILFPSSNLFWLLRLLASPLYLFLLGNAILIAFLKTHFSLFIKIVLILFISNIIQLALMRVPFYGPYYYTPAILTLVLISIYISYLYHYAKIKFLWLPVLAIFTWWEIFMIPGAYATPRVPKVVSDVSKIILADYRSHQKDPIVGIFVISPITSTLGLEYRYFLEKEGIKTFSSSRIASADYIIIEGSLNNQTDLQIYESGRRVRSIKEIIFENGGKEVNFAKIYKVERVLDSF